MNRFILEKLLQKKWMVLSLFVGCVLFISIAALNPIYTNGALQKMLPDCLEADGLENGRYPMLTKYEGKITYFEKESDKQQEKRIGSILKKLSGIEAEKVMDVILMRTMPKTYQSDLRQTEKGIVQIELAAMSDLDAHMKLLDGVTFSDDIDSDGTVKAVVSEVTMQKEKLILGEKITFDNMVDEEGRPLVIEIAGVFTWDDDTDPYWVVSPQKYEKTCFVSQNVFHRYVTKATQNNEPYANYTFSFYRLYDYEHVRAEAVSDMVKWCEANEMEGLSHLFLAVLSNYGKNADKVKSTMKILQLPIMLLLALFIYMVASKMLSMEQNEISVLKSRGLSSLQIFSIYLVQSFVISLVASFVGLLMGCLFARVIGAANSFMEFVNRKPLGIELSLSVWLWLIAAMLFCIAVMTIPVLPRCRVSIVEQKRRGKTGNRPIWKRFYFDVIGIVISGYLCYSFTTQLGSVRQRVQMGEAIDPTLFLASSLFIISCSLLLTRLIPLLVKLVYHIGQKRWPVEVYAAFLQSVRNQDKQSFMMIFLIATVALGIFNAGTARTINANEEVNLRYEIGADIVLEEKFENNLAAIKFAISQGSQNIGPIVHTQPDQTKYQQIEGDIEASTKVYVRDDVTFSGVNGAKDLKSGSVTLMGIHTKEFGQTAYMPEYATGEHWYHALNKMAPDPYGVLVSSNLMNELHLKEGDELHYEIYDEIGRSLGLAKGKIVGAVDYFPGYRNSVYQENEDGTYSQNKQYLVVVSFDMMTSVFGGLPYQRWMKNKEDNEYIYRFLEDNNFILTSFYDADNAIVGMKNNPVIQETNGLLTIGFLVSLLICSVGFLIFQIMSVKERELNFGVYRAMGLARAQLYKMLVFEQLFTTLPAMLLGVLTGIVTTKLYVPLIDVTYASSTSKSLPARIILSVGDMGQLFVILLITFTCCILIMTRIIAGMKIAQALKLGEE